MTQKEGDTDRDRGTAREVDIDRRSAETDRDRRSGGRREAWRDGRSDGRTHERTGRQTNRPPEKDREGKRCRETDSER